MKLSGDDLDELFGPSARECNVSFDVHTHECLSGNLPCGHRPVAGSVQASRDTTEPSLAELDELFATPDQECEPGSGRHTPQCIYGERPCGRRVSSSMRSTETDHRCASSWDITQVPEHVLDEVFGTPTECDAFFDVHTEQCMSGRLPCGDVPERLAVTPAEMRTPCPYHEGSRRRDGHRASTYCRCHHIGGICSDERTR